MFVAALTLGLLAILVVAAGIVGVQRLRHAPTTRVPTPRPGHPPAPSSAPFLGQESAA